MAAPGDKLKEARLKQGLSLKEIAEKTRIQAQFLEALEGNRPEVIPGAFFRKSFLRQYSEFLGLNPDEFSEDSTIEFGSFSGGNDSSSLAGVIHEPLDLPPLPTPGKSRPFPARQVLLSIGLLVGVIAVCAVAYTFWEDFQTSRTAAPPEQQASTESPSNVSAPLEPGTASATPPTSTNEDLAPQETPAETPVAEQSSAPTAAPETAATTPVAGTTPAPSEASGPPTTTVHGSGNRELRLTANALTWVRVREGDRTLFVGTIAEGQTRVVKVNEQAQILTGNAGSLKVQWQGKDLGNIGPVGQIRTVIVTPSESSIQAPAPKPATPNDGPATNGTR